MRRAFAHGGAWYDVSPILDAAKSKKSMAHLWRVVVVLGALPWLLLASDHHDSMETVGQVLKEVASRSMPDVRQLVGGEDGDGAGTKAFALGLADLVNALWLSGEVRRPCLVQPPLVCACTQACTVDVCSFPSCAVVGVGHWWGASSGVGSGELVAPSPVS